MRVMNPVEFKRYELLAAKQFMPFYQKRKRYSPTFKLIVRLMDKLIGAEKSYEKTRATSVTKTLQ